MTELLNIFNKRLTSIFSSFFSPHLREIDNFSLITIFFIVSIRVLLKVWSNWRLLPPISIFKPSGKWRNLCRRMSELRSVSLVGEAAMMKFANGFDFEVDLVYLEKVGY